MVISPWVQLPLTTQLNVMPTTKHLPVQKCRACRLVSIRETGCLKMQDLTPKQRTNGNCQSDLFNHSPELVLQSKVGSRSAIKEAHMRHSSKTSKNFIKFSFKNRSSNFDGITKAPGKDNVVIGENKTDYYTEHRHSFKERDLNATRK